MSAATLVDGSTMQMLRVRIDHQIRGVHISRSLIESGRLATVREMDDEFVLYRTMRGRSIVTRDNSLLSAAARESLDAAGLIRPGTVVDDETVLASVLSTIEIGNLGPRPTGTVRAEDESLRTPFGWAGAMVIAARYDSLTPIAADGPKTIGRISVQLRLVLPLRVGDALLLDGCEVVIADVRESMEADIIADASVGRLLGLPDGQSAVVPVHVGSQPARWAMGARSSGPNSLITNRPLKHARHGGGQAITSAHAHSLMQTGMSANLAESVTLKSDDVRGRLQLALALGGKEDFPSPGTPETFRVMLAELAAIGFKPSLGHFAGNSKMSLAPMTDPDRISCSAGSVTESGMLDHRTLKPVHGGIMCEQTFGPEATAGYAMQFGHIELPEPIVPWIFRMPMPGGAPSILSHTLKIGDEQIAGLLENNLWLDQQGEISAVHAPTGEQLTGPLAIERLLQTLPDEALPPYLTTLAQPRSVLVARTILVLPPGLRPLVMLRNGNFAGSDLNDQYYQVIKHAKIVRMLRPLNVSVVHSIRQLQAAVDCLFANTFLPQERQARGDDGRPLKDLLGIALMRLRDDESKRTNYSAVARAVALPAVQPDVVVIPPSIAKTLQVHPQMPLLVTRPMRTGEFAVPIIPLRAVIHEHSVIGLHPDSYDALFPESSGISHCILHRPMTPQAVDEAVSRIGSVLVASAPPQPSWMDERDLRIVLGTLLETTIGGTRLSFDSPAGILLAGPGTARFSISDQPPPLPPIRPRDSERTWTEIPITWESGS